MARPPRTRAFLWAFGVTLAVALLPLALSVALLRRSAETLPYERAVQVQQRTGAVYGLATASNFFAHKLALVKARRADVLVLGSSRVMQFREEFFRPSFANAGGAMQTMSQGRRFLAALEPSDIPQFLLLGLDFWWFHPAWAVPLDGGEHSGDASTLTMSKVQKAMEWVATGKIPPPSLARILLTGQGTSAGTAAPAMGITAMEAGAGFRPDGSYDYGTLFVGRVPAERNEERRFEKRLRWVDTATGGFERAPRASGRALDELRGIVAWAQQHGVRLVMLLPPNAPPITRKMRDASDGFTFVDELRTVLADIEAQSNHVVEFHDFSYGGGDLDDACEYVDGTHGGEVVYARMLLAMARRERSALRDVIDEPRLRRATSEFQGRTLTVFDPQRDWRHEVDYLELGCAK